MSAALKLEEYLTPKVASKGGMNNKKKRYYVKSENFIIWAVSCIRSLDYDFVRSKLDEYELGRLRYLKSWCENAPLEEMMVIMGKLGFEMFYGGAEKQGKWAGGRKRDAYKETFKKEGKIDDIVKYATENKYFIIASRDMAKTQTLFSQVVNGSWYVPNKDFKALSKILKQVNKKSIFDKGNINSEMQNLKSIIQMFSNFLLTKNEHVTDIELGIIFYMASRDDAPMPVAKIYEVFLYFVRDKAFVSRALTKLKKANYIQFHGGRTRKGTSYVLTATGWSYIKKSLANFMRDIKFWDLEDETKSNNHNGIELQTEEQLSTL